MEHQMSVVINVPHHGVPVSTSTGGSAGPTVEIDEARADLARAIAGRDAAEAEADRKRRAVANTEGLLESVEDDLRRFDLVDDHVEEIQVDQVRRWAENGGVGDPPS